MQREELIETAIRIAKKFIKPIEELSLRSYPDPNSPMGKALTAHGKAKAYRDGLYELPESFLSLSPEPVTLGYGYTEKGLKLGVVWTLEQAETNLDEQVKTRALDVLKSAPNLLNHSPEKLAACVSLQYNIGSGAFKNSTVAKCIAKEDMKAAAEAFKLFNIDNGHVSQGLINRRNTEVALFNSVKE